MYLIATEDYFFDLQSHWNSEPLNCTCILERLLTYVGVGMEPMGRGGGGEGGGGGGLRGAALPLQCLNLGSKCTKVG